MWRRRLLQEGVAPCIAEVRRRRQRPLALVLRPGSRRVGAARGVGQLEGAGRRRGPARGVGRALEPPAPGVLLPDRHRVVVLLPGRHELVELVRSGVRPGVRGGGVSSRRGRSLQGSSERLKPLHLLGALPEDRLLSHSALREVVHELVENARLRLGGLLQLLLRLAPEALTELLHAHIQLLQAPLAVTVSIRALVVGAGSTRCRAGLLRMTSL
mmetsp:Transcript_105356/g.227124  ORF Transcript_105356/g.227124 Transcript_105356/m.227124 type:complete len:214 (+) Transcript_105356:801-1442(+)